MPRAAVTQRHPSSTSGASVFSDALDCSDRPLRSCYFADRRSRYVVAGAAVCVILLRSSTLPLSCFLANGAIRTSVPSWPFRHTGVDVLGFARHPELIFEGTEGTVPNILPLAPSRSSCSTLHTTPYHPSAHPSTESFAEAFLSSQSSLRKPRSFPTARIRFHGWFRRFRCGESPDGLPDPGHQLTSSHFADHHQQISRLVTLVSRQSSMAATRESGSDEDSGLPRRGALAAGKCRCNYKNLNHFRFVEINSQHHQSPKDDRLGNGSVQSVSRIESAGGRLLGTNRRMELWRTCPGQRGAYPRSNCGAFKREHGPKVLEAGLEFITDSFQLPPLEELPRLHSLPNNSEADESNRFLEAVMDALRMAMKERSAFDKKRTEIQVVLPSLRFPAVSGNMKQSNRSWRGWRKR
ncbi:hypothetical protein QBC41DRAFT_138005 [Cercophora samala]|uniref:Uncharacterized protein n=1 Tax=Cercophora samala TaxID=330535 RepID=A0AA39ZAU1_9PEZI|nr:hypothetical protein QBC41DRAFT_138005 [Cercophora samala]